jgi:hypothetical protein
VGINNESPKATLDVTANITAAGSPEGIIAPRLTGDQMRAKDADYASAQTGAIVYATSVPSAPSTKTANVTAAGYYYFNGTVWRSIGGGSGWFYMPSAVLPVKTSDPRWDGTKFNVDLFGVYSQQFTLQNTGMSVKAPSATTLPVKTAATQLEYFITYYDNAVFQNVAVSDDGKLTYTVNAGGTPSEATFMNIVFKEK